MTPQLVFALAAPYGAFAVSFNAANAALKPTQLDPPKSAIIGLLGAALGSERVALNALADGLFVAVRTGVRPRPDPKPDYHTVTPSHSPREKGPRTRFEELRPSGDLRRRTSTGSILSKRHYWQVGLWTIAIARRENHEPSLEEICEALTKPRWPLYAGRKAYSLGLPPDPIILNGRGPREALDAYGWPWTRHPALSERLSKLVHAVDTARQFELRYDLGYPDAPESSFEVEIADEPFHGGTEDRLIRGFRTRQVGVLSVPAANTKQK
jgi:CRISPR system Cascade subunit CasD